MEESHTVLKRYSKQLETNKVHLNETIDEFQSKILFLESSLEKCKERVRTLEESNENVSKCRYFLFK